MGQSRKHNFVREQIVEVQNDKYPPVVEVVALLPGQCAEHGAPYYGCVHSGDHFTFCEEILKPLTTQKKRKLN